MNWKTFTLWSQGVVALLVLLLAIVPANAQSEGGRNQGQPGSLNYVEGRVSIGTAAIDGRSVGSAKLEPGQSIATEQGKAEILLTPGAFLRLGNNTSVKMISSGLTNTEVQVRKGRAMAEIAEIHDENNLRVEMNGATTRLLKTGLYDFDADRNQVRVFDGTVTVQENGAQVEVKEGRDLDVNAGTPLKPEKFDKKTYQDDLYNWSSLRSKYLSESNDDPTYVVDGGAWLGSGWYWSPWHRAYTFIPGDGFLHSPFGWSYYSPGWGFRSHHRRVYRHSGYWGRGYNRGHGYWGRGYHRGNGSWGRGNHRSHGSWGRGSHSGSWGRGHQGGGHRGGRGGGVRGGGRGGRH